MIKIKKESKPISELKEGDKIKIDGKELEVEANILLIDHGKGKEERALELIRNDKEFQLRYFSDMVENSLEFFILKEIQYESLDVKEVEW